MADLNHRTERISLHTGNLRLHAFCRNHLLTGVLNINILIPHIPGILIESQVLIHSARLLVQKIVRTVCIHNNLHRIILEHIFIRRNHIHILCLLRCFQIIRAVTKRRNLSLKRYQNLLCHIRLTEPVVRQVISKRNARIRDLRRNHISVRIAQPHRRKLHLLCGLIAVPYKQIVIAEQMQLLFYYL